ncbi:MAG: cupin domain-containing protein [Sphingomonadales bacterium]
MIPVLSLIEKYQLIPHPEGGHYCSTYRAPLVLPPSSLPESFGGHRPVSTAIFFLLQAGDFSGFHRIKSDECWHFYQGDPLWVHCLDQQGQYKRYTLGAGMDSDHHFQLVVPAGTWFASEPATGSAYSFVGCTVSPGFDIADLEMGSAARLAARYPQQQELIHSRCRLA